MKEKNSISAVIPNYNGRLLLEKNIPLLVKALKKSEKDFEIIISDDSSSDDSVSFLMQNFPSIKVLVSEKNSGFSVTVNKGIMAAVKDLVFVVNSDVALQEDYFLTQFKYFALPDTFGVMGRIDTENGDRTQDAAKYPEWKMSQVNATKNYLITNPLKDFWVPTFFLSGANALMDRKKLQFLGGMDEIFSPFYYEDVDLGIRAWRMNWKCYYDHEAVCFHPLSTTIGKYHKRKNVRVISKRNKLILHAIHLEGVKRIWWTTEVLVQALFRWMLLDKKWYQSFYFFLKAGLQVKLSRERLEKQFASNKSHLSLETVVSNIRSDIGQFDKKLF